MSKSLSSYFKGIAAKRLSQVEINPRVSNQHEFGAGALRKILGDEKSTFSGGFFFLSDSDERNIHDTGLLTWYDSRENQPHRSAEYRLYYTENDVIRYASEGDLLIVSLKNDGNLVVIIAEHGTTMESQLLWLFQLHEPGYQFSLQDVIDRQSQLNMAEKYILEFLDIEVEDEGPDYLDDMLYKFGEKFPTTFEFSKYARETLPELFALSDPDHVLMQWLGREEVLFKTLEKYFLEEKLNQGFGLKGDMVEDFISFSLSVQNRRKSRAGHAFENHLEEIFKQHGLDFSKGKPTERNNKPDFLFPGIDKYLNVSFPSDQLTMLGVKTTAKDRWRQILSEADRINDKHLITLEPSISINQTEEMQVQNVQLVLPEELLHTYSDDQRRHLINLNEFINIVKDKQDL